MEAGEGEGNKEEGARQAGRQQELQTSLCLQMTAIVGTLLGWLKLW
jgi:hypothetical protein